MELTNEFTVPVPVERAWEVLNDVELIAPCLPGAQLQEVEGDEYRGTVKVKVGPITAQYKGAATFQEQDEANRKVVLKAEGRDTRGQGSASALITATMTAKGDSTDVVVETDLTIKGKVAQFGRGMIADVSAKLLTEFVECLEHKLEDDQPAPTEAVPGSDAAQGGGPAPVETTGSPAAEAAKQQADEPAPTDAVPGATAVQGGGPAPVATPGDPAAEAAKQQADDSAAPASGVRKINAPEAKPVDLLDTAGAPLAKRLVPVIVVLVLLLLLGRRRSKKRSG